MPVNSIDGTNVWGKVSHETGATCPSSKIVASSPTTLDGSDTDVVILTGAPVGNIDLITTGDFTKAQSLKIINRHGSNITFVASGTSSDPNGKMATGFSLAPNAIAELVFDPSATPPAWYAEPMTAPGAVTVYKATGTNITSASGVTIAQATHGLSSDRHIGVQVVGTAPPFTGQVIYPGITITNGDVNLQQDTGSDIIADVTLIGTA